MKNLSWITEVLNDTAEFCERTGLPKSEMALRSVLPIIERELYDVNQCADVCGSYISDGKVGLCYKKENVAKSS